MTTKLEMLREVEIPWLMEWLGRSIANLGYPVGCGVAPAEGQLRLAATKLFDRFVQLAETTEGGSENETREQAFLAWWSNRQHATHPHNNPSLNWGSSFKPSAKAAFFAAWDAAFFSAWDAAAKDEREECAKACELEARRLGDRHSPERCFDCAAAIRARHNAL